MSILKKLAPSLATIEGLTEEVASQADKLRTFASTRRELAVTMKADAYRQLDRAGALEHEADVAEKIAASISETLGLELVETTVMA
jgi:hypothetical protein